MIAPKPSSQDRQTEPAGRSGTQAVERALHLLHLMSAEAGRGATLKTIADRAGLDAATTRRLLLALMRAGFVTQETASRHYHLGLEFFSVAAAAANRFDAGGRRRRILGDLSRRTGADAAFFRREGDDMICLDLVRGPAPGRGPEMGARRPIGAEAYGLALLAVLPDVEGESIVIRNVRRYARLPEAAIRQVGEQLRLVRRRGWAAVAETSTESWSLAVAILNRDGLAEASVGLSLAGAVPEQPDVLAAAVAAAGDALQSDLWQAPRATAGAARPINVSHRGTDTLA